MSGTFELWFGGWRTIFIESWCFMSAVQRVCFRRLWRCTALFPCSVHVWPQLHVWFQPELCLFVSCRMFTGLQCRAWWQPTEMTELENQVFLRVSPSSQWGTEQLSLLCLLCLSHLLVGFFISPYSLLSWWSVFIVSFWSPLLIFANILFAPWGCCPDVFAVMYQLYMSVFLFWSFHSLL